MRLPDFSQQANPIAKWVAPIMITIGTLAIVAYATADEPIIFTYNSPPQMFGTLLMMALLPGYLVAFLIVLQRQSLAILDKLKAQSEPTSWQTAHSQVFQLARWSLPIVLAAACYGVAQNSGVVSTMWGTGRVEFMDLAFIGFNCFLWMTIALLTCWRLPLAWRLGQVGRGLQVNLYDMQAPRALASLATKDVLVVAGGMSFMALQSLDAEFRWGNYQGGFYVGIPSALIMLFAPLLGLRANITQSKAARIEVLRKKLTATASDDVAELETISAHIDRIQNTPNWGLDLGLITKVFAYLVIPPLAWVGAALVENLVEGFF